MKGSLAEVAHLNSYSNCSDQLRDIVLFSPYLNNIAKEQMDVYKRSKLNLYVCEGSDIISEFEDEK